jgi:hypothetical protein
VSKFRIGDVIKLVDSKTINSSVFHVSSNGDHFYEFLRSRKVFTVSDVFNEYDFESVTLYGNPNPNDKYDTARFEFAKSHIINQILSEL